MIDQAESLRKLVLNKKKKLNVTNTKNKHIQEKHCRTIMIASGKDKEGKNSIVVNLSITLQKLGYKVLVIDENGGNIDVLMGLCYKYTINDIIYKNKKINDALINGPFGVKLLISGFNISNIELFTYEQWEIIIEALKKIDYFDYVIINMDSGINRNVIGFAAACRDVILITKEEQDSIISAYSLIKALNHFKLNNNFYIIVNKAKSSNDANLAYQKLKFAVKKFLNIDINYLGIIIEDRTMISSTKEKKPLVLNYPQSKSSRDIKLLAQNVINNFDAFEPMSIEDLFKKIFLIFNNS